MGKSSGAAPAAPDPVATANAQAAMNSQAAQESARMSAVDLYGPDGSVTYQRDANGVPIAQTTALNATNKQTYDTQGQIGLTLAQKANQSLGGLPTDSYSMADSAPYDPRAVNTGSMAVWGKGADDFAYNPNSYGDVSQIDQGAADAVWNSGKARLDPMFAQQNDRQAQMLEDRGLPIDGSAASITGADLARNQNDAYLQLENQAYLTGHQTAGDNIQREQALRSSAINEGLTFQNQSNSDWSQKLNTEQQLRGQIQGEDTQDRQRAFNEASIYLQGSPVFNQPNAPSTPSYQVAPPNYAQNVYDSHAGQLAAAEIASKNQASMWGMLGQAGQAIGGQGGLWQLSSKELKIELGDADSLLDRVRRLPVRRWRYRDHPMLDDREHIGPWAEDFSDLFGGPSDMIHLGDAIFVLWRAFQQLADKVAVKQEQGSAAAPSHAV